MRTHTDHFQLITSDHLAHVSGGNFSALIDALGGLATIGSQIGRVTDYFTGGSSGGSTGYLLGSIGDSLLRLFEDWGTSGASTSSMSAGVGDDGASQGAMPYGAYPMTGCYG